MILVVSGATGGHLYPAIALCKELGLPSHVVVSRKSPAAEILSAANMSFSVFYLTKKIMVLWPLMAVKIIALLVQKKPSIILLMGGGICLPFAIIARLWRVPTIAFEQNAIPGRATRLCQWLVDHIVISFEEAAQFLVKKKKLKCLGNPIRLTDQVQQDGLSKELNQLTGNTLLVIGGSQGAKGLNQFVLDHKTSIMAAGYNIIHLAGPKFFDSNAPQFIKERHHNLGYLALPYANQMVSLYQKASLVMCRSGATTLAELDHFGLPAILVPFPFSKDDHQVANADAFCRKNKNAVWFEEARLNWSEWEKSATFLSELGPRASGESQQVLKDICEFIQSSLK